MKILYSLVILFAVSNYCFNQEVDSRNLNSIINKAIEPDEYPQYKSGIKRLKKVYSRKLEIS